MSAATYPAVPPGSTVSARAKGDHILQPGISRGNLAYYKPLEVEGSAFDKEIDHSISDDRTIAPADLLSRDVAFESAEKDLQVVDESRPKTQCLN